MSQSVANETLNQAEEKAALDPPSTREQEQPAPATDRSFSIRHRRGAWRDALRRRMLLAGDAITVVAACAIVSTAAGSPPAPWLLAAVPLWLVLAKLYGLYDFDHRALRHLTVDELPSIVAWATTSAATTVMGLSVLGVEGAVTSFGVRFWLTVLVLAPIVRAGVRSLWRRFVPAEVALLVGSGSLEEATRRKLELVRDIHVECSGVVSEPQLDHGDTTALATALRDQPAVNRVIVASQSVSEELIADLVRFCRANSLKLSVVPPARGMFGTAVQLHHIADLPMIEYSTWDTARSTMFIKRAIDVVVATVGLLVTAPLLAVISLAVKLDSRGPVLFVQRRAGILGKPFPMIKFRTMTADAERRLSEVVDLEQLEDPMFKLRGDPRITTVGRLLRRTSLDELPQLINVLRGEMSLVGPRPEQLDLVARYSGEHRFRLAVKPGLTGPMQVYGRGELRFDERLAVEREYVENLSLRRDLRIVLLTFAAVFLGRGAF